MDTIVIFYRMQGIDGNYTSSLTLQDRKDTHELSQRWILQYTKDDIFLLRPAITPNFCISEKDGAFIIARNLRQGVLLKISPISA